MTINEAALIELIDIAHRHGSVSMEDLRRVLPIDSMTPEEISHVVARLDEAGLDFEIDPALLLPRHDTARKIVAPAAKPGQTELVETSPEGSRQQTSFPASADAPMLRKASIRRAESTYSAPMFPWIFAFAVVVLAVFAFALWIR